MDKKQLFQEPQIVAAIISVIGTIMGTLLISLLLGFLKGEIGVGPAVAVMSFLLVLSIWVLLVFRWGVRLAGVAAAVMVMVGSFLFLIVSLFQLLPFVVPSATPVAVVPTATEVVATPTPAMATATPSVVVPAKTPTPMETTLGRILYHNDWTGNNEIYVANSDGSGEQRLTDHPADDLFPAWSPDGKRVVFGSSRDGQPTPDGSNTSSIYIMDADGSNLTRVTDIESNDKLPTWSPDGSRIAFHKRGDLGVINVDGSNLVRVVTGREDMSLDIPCWSPDSRRIAFKSRVPPEGPCPCQHDIYVVNDDGSGLLKLATFTLEEDGTPEDYAVWSPDGSQVAFEVYLDGRPRYYSVKSDGSGEPVEVESIPQSWYPWYYPQWQGQ